MTLTETWIPKAPPLREDPPGTVRVGDSRVTLDVLLGCYKEGMSAEQIAEAFDTLRIGDVHAVISYYFDHQKEVDEYLAERRREGQALQDHFESARSYEQMREKMLDRRAQRGAQ